MCDDTYIVSVDYLIHLFTEVPVRFNTTVGCRFLGHQQQRRAYYSYLKKIQNAPRPSEHPPVRGEKNVKTFIRWDHRLQIQNLFMAFRRVVCVFFPFILDFNGRTSRDTQEEGNTGFSIHLLSAVLPFIFLARRILPFLSLVDREVEFCVLTI